MNIIAEEIKHPGNPQTVWHGILSALLHDWDYSGLTYGSGAISRLADPPISFPNPGMRLNAPSPQPQSNQRGRDAVSD